MQPTQSPFPRSPPPPPNLPPKSGHRDGEWSGWSDSILIFHWEQLQLSFWSVILKRYAASVRFTLPAGFALFCFPWRRARGARMGGRWWWRGQGERMGTGVSSWILTSNRTGSSQNHEERGRGSRVVAKSVLCGSEWSKFLTQANHSYWPRSRVVHEIESKAGACKKTARTCSSFVVCTVAYIPKPRFRSRYYDDLTSWLLLEMIHEQQIPSFHRFCGNVLVNVNAVYCFNAWIA